MTELQDDNRTPLQRVAAGDATAVNEVLEKYGNLVWSIALRRTPNRAEAEDAVQDVFIELWKSAGRFDPSRGSEETFVGTIARRRLIDRIRKKTREPRMDDLEAVVEPSAPTGWSSPETGAEAQQVAEILSSLKPEQQKVIVLSVYHGWSHSSIAEKLEMPIGTVKTHIRRGLLQVREMLSRSGDGAGGARGATS